MLSPGGIDTPFNHGKWNPEKKRGQEQQPAEDEKKKKKHRDTHHAESNGVLGNLAHLLSSASQNGEHGPTHTITEK